MTGQPISIKLKWSSVIKQFRCCCRTIWVLLHLDLSSRWLEMSQESWSCSLWIQRGCYEMNQHRTISEKIMCLASPMSTESLLTSSNSRFYCHCCSCLVFLVLFLMMGSHICSPGQPWLPCVAQYDTNWSSCLLFPCTGIASTLLLHPASVDSLIFYPLAAPIPIFMVFFCLSNTVSFGCPQAINPDLIEMQSHLT